MKKFKNSMILIFFILIYALPGITVSRVDWIDGKIRSTGSSHMAIDESGSPVDMETGKKLSISEARNAAYERSREKALAEAIRMISEIQVDNEKKVKDLIREDPEVRQNLPKALEEFSVFRDNPSGYLSSACDLEFPLGHLLTILNYSFPGNSFPVRDDIDIQTKYTSLIIDVRGLGIRPMLLPAVLNENGLEIYSKNFIRPADAVKYNSVSYVHNEKDAIKHKKSGKHPLFCAALRNVNGNPVISDNDAKKIFSHKKNIEYLSKCRVIFIIDR